MLRQLYAFILGLSLFGNPMAVLESFAAGIKALFYEPYEGAVLGPEEFVLGLGTGVKNFLGYTVGMLAFFTVVYNVSFLLYSLANKCFVNDDDMMMCSDLMCN